jgi:hypothetical protein
MRSILCSLVFAAGLLGQTAGDDKVAIGNLASTLVGIGKAHASRAHLSQRLADDMFEFAKRDHEPQRTVVVRFTEEFTAALYGKELSTRSVGVLQQSIRDLMRGTTATFAAAAALRQILTQAGVESTKAQLVTRNFMAIGEEIKGPDDVGARQ